MSSKCPAGRTEPHSALRATIHRPRRTVASTMFPTPEQRLTILRPPPPNSAGSKEPSAVALPDSRSDSLTEATPLRHGSIGERVRDTPITLVRAGKVQVI